MYISTNIRIIILTFHCSGAIDYTDQVSIELSLDESKVAEYGFVEIHPLDLMWKINDIKHIQIIIMSYFLKIVKRIPCVSDKNESLPLEKRFTKVYYKCYRSYQHSHTWNNPTITDITLDEAIKYIKKKNLSIRPI